MELKRIKTKMIDKMEWNELVNLALTLGVKLKTYTVWTNSYINPFVTLRFEHTNRERCKKALKKWKKKQKKKTGG